MKRITSGISLFTYWIHVKERVVNFIFFISFVFVYFFNVNPKNNQPSTPNYSLNTIKSTIIHVVHIYTGHLLSSWIAFTRTQQFQEKSVSLQGRFGGETRKIQSLALRSLKKKTVLTLNGSSQRTISGKQ